MSRTEAAELARLRIQFPRWRIDRTDTDSRFVAVRRRTGGRRIEAGTLAALEHELMLREG